MDEDVDRDVPWLGTRDLIAETKHFAAEQPVHEGNGVLSLVVARNGDVDVVERAISVGEGNYGDVTIGGFIQRLVVLKRVGDDQQARLLELVLNVVRESTGSEAAGNWGSLGVGGILEDGTLGEWGGSGALNGADGNISGIFDGDDDSSSQNELLPGLSDVDDMNTVFGTSLEYIASHVGVAVAGAEVDLAGKHLAGVFFGQGQHWRKGRHFH